MSYQVLARKWRPKSFSTLVGQEHVVRALTHALSQQRLHHAYLFTGTRGVGKTTIARIMAKSLNCETGISASPCGQCGVCTEIDAGRFVDYIEMDAASNRGVDDMTQLLEQAVYAPSRGRFKVYVIDEVHQLTGHAFNAMLKTLEEPPEHVKFILATTDPQKIPVTVLSRCLQFNLKQMPPQHIVDHLSRVLMAEEIPFEAPALRYLAKAAAGSMRDALSLLDQAIAHGAGKVEENGVRDMLGTVGEDYLYGLLEGLARADFPAMLALAEDMNGHSLSFDAALQDLATLIHRIALAQMAPQALEDPGERERLLPFTRQFDPEFLQLAYQIVTHGRADLALAPDEYAGFTMTLLRLSAFKPVSPPALGLSDSAAGPDRTKHPWPAAAAPRSDTRPQPQTVMPGPAVTASNSSFAKSEAPVALNLTSACAAEAAPAPEPKQATKPESSPEPAAVTPAPAAPETVPVAVPAAALAPAVSASEEKTPVALAAAPESPVVAAAPAPVVTSPESEPRVQPQSAPAAAAKVEKAQTSPKRIVTDSYDLPPEYDAPASALADYYADQGGSAMPESIPLEGIPAETPAARPTPRAAEPASALPSEGAGERDEWHKLLDSLALRGAERAFAHHLELVSIQEAMVQVRLSPAFKSLLISTRPQDKLQNALSDKLKRPIRLQIDIAEQRGVTPAQRLAWEKQERLNEAIASLEADEFVRETMELMDATLIESSVRPL